MSPQPNPYLSLVERRKDQAQLRIAFVGSALVSAKKIFRREEESVHADHYDQINGLIEAEVSERYDCAVVDLRTADDRHALWLASLAAKRQIKRIIVLAAPFDEDKFNIVPGVHRVLPAPVSPRDIMQALFEASLEVDAETSQRARDLDEERELAEKVFAKERALKEASETAPDDMAQNLEEATEPRALDPLPQEPMIEALEIDAGEASQKADTKGDFETSIGSKRSRGRSLWSHFLPVANFLYKKLAVVVLGSLFMAFMFYGAMIVFFLLSSTWSLPFELSRGHELVVRTERDLSQLQVRRNEVAQRLEAAKVHLETAQRDEQDAELNLTFMKQSLAVEQSHYEAQLKNSLEHIERLKFISGEFKTQDKSGAFTKDIDRAFRSRRITRKVRDKATLSVLEARQRMASAENEVALQGIEVEKLNTRIAFLKSLQTELDRPSILSLLAPDAQLSLLARDIIRQRNTVARSKSGAEIARKEAGHLDDSLNVVEANIASIETTPLGKALKTPVGVLFVPYSNIENYELGQPLYSCKLSIMFCSKVGETGAVISGETNAVHPLFGKPLRGVFVEAQVDNQNDIKEELLHVGRPPLFF